MPRRRKLELHPQTKAMAKRASMLLKEHGWVQGTFYRTGEGYCIAGAINKAASYIRPSFPRTESDHKSELRAYIEGLLTKRLHRRISLEAWNDRSRRKKQDVLDILRQAAES